jgi:hypothetical protein
MLPCHGVEENTGKPKPGWLLSVGAPCFSIAERSHFDLSGFSPGFKTPRLSRRRIVLREPLGLKAEPPPHECGGSHHAIWTRPSGRGPGYV